MVRGYCGEWFASGLMHLLYPADYEPTGDGQKLVFNFEYTLDCIDSREVIVHRVGKIRLTKYGAVGLDSPPEAHEHDLEVRDYWHIDTKAGLIRPAF